MKYFDTVVLIHRNNAENYTENKVAIITVIIIISAHFLYFPSPFILGIETHHNNSHKTAFLWLQLAPSDSSQAAGESLVNVSRIFCERVLLITSNHQQVYSPPTPGRVSSGSDSTRGPCVIGDQEFLCFPLMPIRGWQSLTSRALSCSPGVSVISYKLINAAG